MTTEEKYCRKSQKRKAVREFLEWLSTDDNKYLIADFVAAKEFKDCQIFPTEDSNEEILAKYNQYLATL